MNGREDRQVRDAYAFRTLYICSVDTNILISTASLDLIRPFRVILSAPGAPGGRSLSPSSCYVVRDVFGDGGAIRGHHSGRVLCH
jgi:hypothetical protein